MDVGQLMGVGRGVLFSILVEASWSAEILNWEEAAIDESQDQCEENYLSKERTMACELGIVKGSVGSISEMFGLYI